MNLGKLFDHMVKDGQIDTKNLIMLGHQLYDHIVPKETHNVLCPSLFMSVMNALGERCNPEIINAYSMMYYVSINSYEIAKFNN